jgi:squalene-hopene/tetraprenyl-beta-curcumene cyclase
VANVVRLLPALILPVALLGAGGKTERRRALEWNPQAAAAYLDSRTKAWMSGGAMDHGTFCISCHTALPYALARPSMRSQLGESETSPVERQLLASITKRVTQWNDIQPYLGDKTGGPATESVLNALVLAESDARTGRLTDTTNRALQIMWSEQIKTGDRAGAWPWVSFGNEPWEAPDSVYWGATLAALATATSPEGYAHRPSIRADFMLLKNYLSKGEAGESLLNRLGLLWASWKIPSLLSPERETAIVRAVLERQQADGGWSTSSLIPTAWKRHDGSAQEAKSDGYATGLVACVLEDATPLRARPQIHAALDWLSRNQDRTSGGWSAGAWPTVSPNVKRDVKTDAGKFMTDAATAFAALALSNYR